PIIEIGAGGREPVQAAVKVGILLTVILRLGVDDGRRLVCRGAVIERDEATPVNLTAQNGEIVGSARYGCVRFAGGSRSAHSSSSSRFPPGVSARTAWLARRRTASGSIRARPSSTKAQMSTLRACSASRPRAMR